MVWICWDLFYNPGIFFCVFLLLYRMFSACQLGLTVLFRSSSFLLGFWVFFCPFLRQSWHLQLHLWICLFLPLEDEVVGWHHWLNGHEFEQTPEDGEGQGSLACCSPWGCKESDTTEQRNSPQFHESRAPVFWISVWCICIWIVMAPHLSLCNVPLYIR